MYIYKRKAQYHETDKMGVIHHSNYVKWMEEARIEYMESVGVGFKAFDDVGTISPIISVALEYKRPVYFEDEVEIAEDELQDIRWTEAALHQCSHRFQNRQFGLERCDNFLRGVRHELDDEAARMQDAAVFAHHDAESHRTRSLFRDGEVVGQVVADFTSLQFDLSVVWLLEAEIHALCEHALTDGTAHV